MTFISRGLLLVNILIVLRGPLTDGSLIRRFNYDARLYEHYALDSRYIQYSRTSPEQWSNITALLEAFGLESVSMICTSGPGAWLFYPEENYQQGNTQTYYMVVGENCVRSDDIDSIQPLGKMDELLDDGVLLFSKPQFSSPAQLVEGEEGSGEAASLIYTGDSPFLVSGSNGKICLSPSTLQNKIDSDQDDLCLIPDLAASFGIEGSVTVKAGCGEDLEDNERVVVQNCYDDGIHEIYTDTDLSIQKLNQVCAGSGSNFEKGKFSVLIDMWTKRLGRQVTERPTHYSEEQALQLKVLWEVLDLFKKTCLLVDEMYIYLLGNIFVMHLREIWKNAGNASVADPATLTFASSFFAFCGDKMTTLPSDPDELEQAYLNACKESDAFDRIPDASLEYASSWHEIANGEVFDPVIEQIWLIINHVIPKCSTETQYITNDWSDLVLLFHYAFLTPVQDIWMDPADWRKVYSAVFHGYDMREEHRNVLQCLQLTLRASPQYDPIGRPRGFKEVMFRKYVAPLQNELPQQNQGPAQPTA